MCTTQEDEEKIDAGGDTAVCYIIRNSLVMHVMRGKVARRCELRKLSPSTTLSPHDQHQPTFSGLF